jgi:hypothetical protein
MNSRSTNRIERAANEHLGATGMPGPSQRRAPPAYHLRADYSWTMHLVMWVGVDPRRVRWDKTCPPQTPMESNRRRSARTRWIGEVRP